jgi:hypothetical protein
VTKVTTRRAYFTLVAALLALGLVAAITRSPEITGFLTITLPITAVGALVSVAYLWRIYSGAGRSSWVFRTLIEASALKVAAGIYIGLLATLFLIGIVVPRELTAPFSIVAANLLMTGPIYYAATIAGRRHRTGRPLPLRDDD